MPLMLQYIKEFLKAPVAIQRVSQAAGNIMLKSGDNCHQKLLLETSCLHKVASISVSYTGERVGMRPN